jgi:hypothetical protein
LKVEEKDKRFNTEDAEGTEKKRKRIRKEPVFPVRTGMQKTRKTGHYKEEPYDERREKSGVGSGHLRGG